MQSQQNGANSDKKIASLEVLKELKCDGVFRRWHAKCKIAQWGLWRNHLFEENFFFFQEFWGHQCFIKSWFWLRKILISIFCALRKYILFIKIISSSSTLTKQEAAILNYKNLALLSWSPSHNYLARGGTDDLDKQKVFPKSTKDANKFGDPTIQ